MRKLRGDTIVEVLLALAIMSAVLAGAYVATNRSLKVGRDAQERTEALELARGQLDKVKQLSIDQQSNPDKNVFVNNDVFCIGSDALKKDIADIADVDNYPADCKSNFYRISVEYASNLYTVRVVWQGITGNTSVQLGATNLAGYAQVVMYYRVQAP